MLGMGDLALVVPSGSIPEPDLRGMVMLLAVNLVLYTRAIFIPSSARRTLAVSATPPSPWPSTRWRTRRSASRSGR